MSFSFNSLYNTCHQSIKIYGTLLLTRKSINKEPNTKYKVSAQMHTPNITVSTTTYKRSTFFQLRRRGSTSPNVNQTIHNQVEIPPHSKVPFCSLPFFIYLWFSYVLSKQLTRPSQCLFNLLLAY